MSDEFSAVLASIRKAIPSVHKEGYPFIAIGVVLTLLFAWLHLNFLFWPFLLLTCWCVAFFRDPPRVTPLGESFVISPADGTIASIDLAVPPLDLDLGEEELMRISVFMSVFDAHVNRAPVAGNIARVSYKPGIFLNADLDKASEDNERNGIVIESGERKIGVVQIAGLVARRIVCFVKEGDALAAGERFGLIRFGSRVDVYLPESVSILVGVGQKVIGGESVLADFRSLKPQRQFKEN